MNVNTDARDHRRTYAFHTHRHACMSIVCDLHGATQTSQSNMRVRQYTDINTAEKITETWRHRDTDTETQRHRNTETQRHRDTET